MSFKLDMSLLEKGLGSFENKSDLAFRMYAETAALKLEGRAKQEASWTDRSAEARRRLKGSIQPMAKGYRVKLSHGVDYGVWLEVANEKKYAIIEPSINKLSPEIMKGLNNLIDKMK